MPRDTIVSMLEKTQRVFLSNYNIPESLRAFCNIVSLTAANTSRIWRQCSSEGQLTFEVSVACVRWGYTLNLARLVWVNLHKMYFAALLMSAPPVYSGK